MAFLIHFRLRVTRLARTCFVPRRRKQASEEIDDAQNMPKFLRTLHLGLFIKVLQRKGVTTVEDLCHLKDGDFRSIGMNEAKIKVIMSELLKLQSVDIDSHRRFVKHCFP